MQARAIFEACAHVTKEPVKWSMLKSWPLAATRRELDICRQIIDDQAEQIKPKPASPLNIWLAHGRIAATGFVADDLADEFFFGTNDLTQTAPGISRTTLRTGAIMQMLAFIRVIRVTMDIEGVGALGNDDKGRNNDRISS